VTSQQLRFYPIDLQEMGIKPHKVPSWTLDEYAEATKDPALRAQVADKMPADDSWVDQLQSKYYLAGGSCRFMFHYTEKEVMDHINYAVSTCSNLELLLGGTQGNRATESVSSLLQDVSGGSFLVSRFASRCVGKICESSFINRAKFHCPNVSFDGWILEMDFMMQIRQAAGLNLVGSSGEHLLWEKVKSESFRDPTELEDKVLSESQWLLPERWNQGGYDAVRVEVKADGVTVQFAQVTRAENHGFKARFMNHMLAALAKNKVKFFSVLFCGSSGKSQNI